MSHLQIYSGDQTLWQEAARRMHRASVEVAAAPSKPTSPAVGVVFAGATQVDATAIERELAAGRHVLVAAEPCLPTDSIQSLAAAAKRANVRLIFENPDRRLPSRQMIKKQIGGPLGSPELVRMHRWESHAAAATTAPLGLPGALVAEIDLALWLVGRSPESAFALEHRAPSGGDGGRFLQVHLSFCPGMALIDYDDRLPHTRGEPNDGYRSLSIIGSSGSAQTDDQANTQLAYRGGAPRALSVGEGVAYWAKLTDDFATAISAEATPPQDGSDGVADWIAAAEAVAALRRSLTERQAVKLSAGERKVR